MARKAASARRSVNCRSSELTAAQNGGTCTCGKQDAAVKGTSGSKGACKVRDIVEQRLIAQAGNTDCPCGETCSCQNVCDCGTQAEPVPASK